MKIGEIDIRIIAKICNENYKRKRCSSKCQLRLGDNECKISHPEYYKEEIEVSYEQSQL